MEESRRADLTERSNKLRVELKLWEKEYTTANNGKKASRDAIKQNPEIAAKYKEYNKVRDILSGKVVEKAPEPIGQTPRKRKHEDEAGHGVSKRLQLAKTPSKTPSKTHVQPWEVDPYDSPSVVRNLFTPSRKTVLGPTPQKDGQVLGLFDLLQQEEGVETSPSGGEKTLKVPFQGTPRKATEGTPHKHSRTPGGRKKLLDAFATPLKNRDMNGQGGRTPSSVSKLHFSTPSFLRRDNHRVQMPVVHENEDGVTLSPEMVRIPRKPLVRGLSSMLAGLRKMQDDAADDELEALHEMEMEEAGETIPKPKPKPKPKSIPVIPEEPAKDILVGDSQPGFPLGGFDDEAQFDSEPEAAEEPRLGRDGKPMKVYKKKGQKRTTRRVKIKPTRAKPAVKPKDVPEESEDELAGSGPEAVPETQIDETPFAEPTANFDSDTQSEYTASEGGTRYKRPNQTKNRQANKDGKIKTAARKVGAMAHQNFKRLKLRNSGAKGGPAHNSRFRRKK